MLSPLHCVPMTWTVDAHYVSVPRSVDMGTRRQMSLSMCCPLTLPRKKRQGKQAAQRDQKGKVWMLIWMMIKAQEESNAWRRRRELLDSSVWSQRLGV